MNEFAVKSKVECDILSQMGTISKLSLCGSYLYECFDAQNNLKWIEETKNQIVNEGLNYMLDRVLNIGGAIDPWFVGIYTATVGSIADLIGTDIGGDLTEFTNYTGSRISYTGLRTGQTISNVLAKAEFPILGAGTILGSFLASDNAGPASILLSVDAFSTGARLVSGGDTLRVTYELTAGNA